MVAYSEMLSSIVSFNWYSLLVERDGVDVFKFFNRWLGVPNSHENYYINNANKTPVETPHPDFLVVGTRLVSNDVTEMIDSCFRNGSAPHAAETS